MGGEKDGKGCKTGLTGKISDGYVNMEGSQLKGNSVGLLSIWVLACVTIGGNLMGVVGMVIFIPLASVFYSLFRSMVYRWLREKHKEDTAEVMTLECKYKKYSSMYLKVPTGKLNESSVRDSFFL